MADIYDDEILNDESNFAEDTEENPSEEFENRIKLQQKLESMTQDERDLLMKIVQFDLLEEMMSAMKNLKKTGADTWKNIIGKLNSIKDISVSDESGFDFKEFLKIILPLLGALAATLLALRESDKKESESADVDYDTEEIKKIKESVPSPKSIVISMCENETNEFSF